MSDFDQSTEPEEYLRDLLLADEIIINNGHWIEGWPKDHITIAVICSDVFAWGCADAENILFSELKDLHEHWRKDKKWGTAVWCMKKRKQWCQGPLEKYLIESGYDLKTLKKDCQ